MNCLFFFVILLFGIFLNCGRVKCCVNLMYEVGIILVILLVNLIVSFFEMDEICISRLF